MRADERLTPQARSLIERAVEDAGGNEVFCACSVDAEGRIEGVRIAARGDRSSVPALMPFVEKSDVVVHNHPSGRLTPSRADLAVAASLGNQGIGFYIVDNAVEQVYVVAEAVRRREHVPLDPDGLADHLRPGGTLSRVFRGYEERTSQVDMLYLVCRSLDEQRVCACEAGTGVGKSLAYLIPALSWAERNEERVVVSTATINLQQQLMENDIPLVKRLLGVETKVVLVKGRSNYLCLRRLEDAGEEAGLMGEDGTELAAIREWAESTDTGSRSDLSFYPRDELWYRVCSDADTCHGLYCVHREGCFVLRVRREAASAGLLVVNHHLLFSDLSVRMTGGGAEGTAVLPPFSRVVFDEAHNIESSATSFFSETVSRFSVRKHLSRLVRRSKGRVFGALPAVEKLLPRMAREKLARVPDLAAAVADRADLLDARAQTLLGGQSSLLVDRVEPDDRTRLLMEPMGDLLQSLLQTIHLVEEALGFLPEEEFDGESAIECRLVVRRLKQTAGACDRYRRFGEFAEDITWLERARGFSGDRYVRFVITPLHVAPLMQEALFDAYPAMIFTSATLTVGGTFDYWKSRIGLGGEILEHAFPSPFDYGRNVLLGIPSDAPVPTDPDYQVYASDLIREVLEISEGRALVLFTSYAMLNATYDAVQPALRDLGIHIFKQGEDDRGRLLERFRTDASSVLFATHSFWEGIDAPGQSLEVLILCRLPFRVPTEPVLLARTEAIRREGGNPFLELSLPDAAIKLKQGFGRLMRRSSDHGIILILDSRIVRKSYGPFLLGSLPEAARSIKDRRYMVEDVENFLADVRGREVGA